MGRSLAIDDLYRFLSVSDPQLSPDGTRIAFVLGAPDREKDEEIGHIYVVAADGGEPVQLTRGECGDTSPRWSPDCGQIAFISSRGEKVVTPQVWLMALAGSEPRKLTSAQGGVLGLWWSPDGASIAFISKVEPERGEGEAAKAKPVVITRLLFKSDGAGLIAGKNAHLFVIPASGGDALQLTSGDISVATPAWALDGASIVFASAIHDDRDIDAASHLFSVPSGGGALKQLTRGEGRAHSPLVTSDGKVAFAGTRSVRDVQTTLFSIPITGGVPRELLPGFDRSVMVGAVAYPGARPQLARDGSIVFCARVGGCVHAFRVAAAGGKPVAIFAGPERVVGGMSVQGSSVVVVAGMPSDLGDLYMTDASGKSERRLTNVNRDVLAELDVTKPESRAYVAPDGTAVEAFVYGVRAENAPLLLDVHGGPHNAWGPALSSSYLYRQVLVAQGWCVVAPNVRGSDGYGRKFMEGVKGGWGVNDEMDFHSVVDGLVDAGVADPDRVAISGYSYGGYMSAWMAGRSRRFRAVVVGAAVTDLRSLYGRSDFGSIIGMAEVGAEPFEQPDLYAKLSPITYVANVSAPVLILHGEADDRCEIGQGEDFFAALRRRRQTVEMVRYPGSSHLFIAAGRPSHKYDYQTRIVDWVTRHSEANRKQLAGLTGSRSVRNRRKDGRKSR